MLLLQRVLKTLNSPRPNFMRRIAGVTLPGDIAWACERFQTFYDRATTAYVIDPVTDYLYGGTEQEDFSVADFPCLIPLHSTFWMETRRPLSVRSEVNGNIDPGYLPKRWGVLFTGAQKNPEERPSPEFQAAYPDMAASVVGHGWMMTGMVVFEIDAGALGLVPMMRFMSIDERGFEHLSNWLGKGTVPPSEEQKRAFDLAVTLFYPMQLAIRYLNEGRVTTTPVAADPTTDAHLIVGAVGPRKS